MFIGFTLASVTCPQSSGPNIFFLSQLSEFYEVKNATEFDLQAYGDWERKGKCVYLHRQANFNFPKNLDNSGLVRK